MPGIDEKRQFIPVRIAVLTVSDTRTLEEDKSGRTWSTDWKPQVTNWLTARSAPTRLKRYRPA